MQSRTAERSGSKAPAARRPGRHRRPLLPLLENVGESGAACLVTMVQGNLLAITLGQARIAERARLAEAELRHHAIGHVGYALEVVGCARRDCVQHEHFGAAPGEQVLDLCAGSGGKTLDFDEGKFRAALESVRATLVPARPAPRPAAQPPAVQPAQQPLAVAAAAPRSSHRGLYMALGAVVMLAVLGVAAFQPPKWFGTRAGAPASQETVAPAPVEPPPQSASQPPAEPVAPAPSEPVATTPPEPRPEPVKPAVTQAVPAVKRPPAVKVTQPVATPAMQDATRTASHHGSGAAKCMRDGATAASSFLPLPDPL